MIAPRQLPDRGCPDPGPEPGPLRIATDVGPGSNIPYCDLFYAALEPFGVELQRGPWAPTRAWIGRNRGRIDAVHFHWPEYFWRVRFERLRASLPWLFRIPLVPPILDAAGMCVRLWQFNAFLDAARGAGVRVIRTLHNLEDHEGDRLLDRVGYHLLIKKSDLIICHGEAARRACDAKYGTAGRSVVMPHGNFDGYYPTPRPRDLVLGELGLRADLPVACCLGGLRDYKGLDVACRAVAKLAGQVQLIVAGNPHPRFQVGPLDALIREAPGAVLLARRLSDQEFADLASASTLMLLPYRKITTSGFLMAALTLGRGVVASDLPYMREVLSMRPGAGVLVPPGDPDALAEGIREYLSVPPEARAEAVNDLAGMFDWKETCRPVGEILAGWKEPRRDRGQAVAGHLINT